MCSSNKIITKYNYILYVQKYISNLRIIWFFFFLIKILKNIYFKFSFLNSSLYYRMQYKQDFCPRYYKLRAHRKICNSYNFWCLLNIIKNKNNKDIIKTFFLLLLGVSNSIRTYSV